MDIEKALLDPASTFESPSDVYNHSALTRDQKIEILRRWEYDARELQVAEEENMGGPGENPLDKVLSALRQLDAATQVEHSAPTKQG